MENDPLIDDFPITTSIYNGLSMAMSNNQMVYSEILSGRSSGIAFGSGMWGANGHSRDRASSV